ncbi:hypothetical protein EI94DRAFT_1800166 [Lactarius quietus]|nr:hypothetical protein EI94DRAFT_1800166 [Lactarius quietus]
MPNAANRQTHQFGPKSHQVTPSIESSSFFLMHNENMPLDFVSDDISDHAPLDEKVYAVFESDCNKEPPPAKFLLTLLLEVVATASDKMDQKFKDITVRKQILEEYSPPDADENSNLKKLLRWCWQCGSFEKIRRLKFLQPMAVLDQADWEKSNHIYTLKRLDIAYGKPFLGNTATNFLNFLLKTGDDILHDNLLIYARAISILQSSGMGKSHLLTEVGKLTFTLPICLRHPKDPGYPPSDEAVYSYFEQIKKDNDMSYTAHSAIAFFLAAAHKTMLKWLRDAQQKNRFDRCNLHQWWYDIMEQRVPRNGQSQLDFFTDVLSEMKSKAEDHGERSSKSLRETDGDDIVAKSRLFYEEAREAVEALMSFLTDLGVGSSPICVTYFDEAHELELWFWILMRLLSHQPLATAMWYVFMGTKSSVSYFSPSAQNLLSLRLVNELQKLLLPYITLGFDQNVLKGRQEVTAKISELQSLEHLATYGHPMWKAHLPQEEANEMVTFASWKLIIGYIFNDQDINQVFAVLSQRLCIEPVLVGSEGIALAD